MLRFLSIALAAGAVFMSYGADPASARGAPWCSVSRVGPDDVVTDCSFRTFEQCVPYILAGNRGFCEQNPYYSGPPPRWSGHYPRRVRRN